MVQFEQLLNDALRMMQQTACEHTQIPPEIDIDEAASFILALTATAGIAPDLTLNEARDAVTGFLAGDQSPFVRIALARGANAISSNDSCDVEETILFCALLAVRAQWATPSRVVSAAADAPVNVCPVCGSIGRLEIIAGEDGVRSLICPICDARWRIPRVGCPHCGESDGARIQILSTRHDPGHAMVHCRSCARAWRRRDMGRQPYPEAMSLTDAFLPWIVESTLAESGVTPVPLRASDAVITAILRDSKKPSTVT